MPQDIRKALTDFRASKGGQDIHAALADFRAKKAAAAQPVAEQTQEPGFFAGINQDLHTRANNLDPILSANQSNSEKIFQTLGQGAGFLGDILGRGVSAIVPDSIEKPVTGALGKIMGSQYVKPLVDSYNQFSQAHPEASRNIDAAANIASLIPADEILGIGGKAAGTGLKVAGEAIEESGNKSLQKGISKYVQDLVAEPETAATKLDRVARTTEKGFGPFKRSVIEPNFREARAAEEVAKIPGIKPGNTFQRSYNIISDFNESEAENLKRVLKANDFQYSKHDLLAQIENVKLKFLENPALAGDGEGVSERILTKARSLIDNSDGTASSLLQARQDLDKAVKLWKGEGIFDPAKESAFSIALRDIRETMNHFLDSEAERMNVPKSVKESLARQTALFNAAENIAPKAAKEADTAIGRSIQKMSQILGTKNKFVQGIAAAAGIGGLGAAATFAPAAAVIGGLGLVTYAGGKIILKPELRIALGKALQAFSRTASVAEKNAAGKEIALLKKVVESDDLGSIPELLNFDDVKKNADNITVGKLQNIIKTRSSLAK